MIELEMSTYVKIDIAPLGDKLRENQLRWFEHVYRRPIMHQEGRVI